MPESQEQKSGNSGGSKAFWGEHYREDRYRQKDGTTLPLYDQVLIEETCNKERFDPIEEDHKRSLHRNRFSKLLGG